MKKLLMFLAVIGAAVLGHADEYSKFGVPVLVKRGGVCNIPATNYVAYCYFTADHLSITIPEGQEYSAVISYDENENVISRQKTLAEYLMVEPVEGWHRLAPMHFVRGRYTIFEAESLAIWNAYLSPYGLGVGTWKTMEEYKATLPEEEL